MKQIKSFLSKIWPQLQAQIIEQLKGAAVKAAIKAFFKTGAGVGFKAWLVTFVVENLFEEVAEPIIKAAFTYIGYSYRRVEGNIFVERLVKAQENNDETGYNSTVDDILS